MGMHRSGTSCLTGSLQQAGLFLGNHSTWNPFNRKGNRENPEIMALHEEILQHNNGSWNEPPATIQPSEDQLNTAREIITGYAGEPVWGFKDPRSLLVLGMWQELIPRLNFIGIFRHPVSVAKSLQRRGFDNVDDALGLWETYNRIMLNAYAEKPFPIVSFDWPQDRFHDVLNGAISRFNLAPIADDKWFYSPELHNHAHQDDDKLPASVKQLYKELQDISASADSIGKAC
ncbi:MAG: sulfotransferase family protein [Pseudomonadales bacterium]